MLFCKKPTIHPFEEEAVRAIYFNVWAILYYMHEPYFLYSFISKHNLQVLAIINYPSVTTIHFKKLNKNTVPRNNIELGDILTNK